jgi:chemotaxis protein CheC
MNQRTPVVERYTELQLDALRELANVGSGTASTALSNMVGHPVDVSVPNARVLPFVEAIQAAGPPTAPFTAVTMPLGGEFPALVLMLLSWDAERSVCRLLGVEAGTDVGRSAVGEIGNILGSCYVGALGAMTGIDFQPGPPRSDFDMLGAIVASALAAGTAGGDTALLVDSDLSVESQSCSLSFLLVPSENGVDELLQRLGVG